MIAFNNRDAVDISTGDFTNLDIGKLLALQGGGVMPIEGQTTGQVEPDFHGTNFRNAIGTLNADITANAGYADSGLVPDQRPGKSDAEPTAIQRRHCKSANRQ